MTTFINDQKINWIAKALQRSLIDVGVDYTALIDISGSVIVQRKKENLVHDIDNMAVLAAGNFSAVCAIAERIGEGEVSLLVHKGKKGHIYINKIMDGFLLMTIFGKEPSVGILRLKITEVIAQIQKISVYSLEEKSDNGKRPGVNSKKFSISGIKSSFGHRFIHSFRDKLKYRVQGYIAKYNS